MTKDIFEQLEYNEMVRNLRHQEKIGITVSEEHFKNQVKFELERGLLDRYVQVNPLIGEQMLTVKRNLYCEMNSIDQKTYDEFPDSVEIYRGCCFLELESNRGQSWTINLNIAKFFAWEYMAYKGQKARVVLKAIIPKDAIYAYTNLRDECECIIEPEKLIDVKIHSTKNYCKEKEL